MTRTAHVTRTPESIRLVALVTGPAGLTGHRQVQRLILDDGQLRRVGGRFLVGNAIVPGDDGRPQTRRTPDGLEVVTRRHRFRIPKGHPWRGVLPTTEAGQ